MSQIVNSTCPLCQSTAKCEEHMIRRLKHFACPVCKEFVIKNKAEQHIVGSSAVQTKEKFSAYSAKAAPGMVTLLHFEPNGAGNVPTVVAEYLSLQEAIAR